MTRTRRTILIRATSVLLRYAKHGASSPRIPPHFAFRRLDRLPHGFQLGGRNVLRAHRYALRQPIAGRALADEALHDAVLERMEADDGEPTAALERARGPWERHFELFKLLIEVNPNSLKGPGRRMLARLARANRATHDRGKLPCGPERLASPRINNRCCNCLSKPFFPIDANHLPQFFFVDPVEPLRGALAARGVHAHVQGAIADKAETASRIVQLRAGHAEIEQHARHLRDASGSELLGHGREPRVDQLKTRIFERAMRMRLGVLIKSEKSSANTETGEDGRAVPAATKGAIDIGFAFADVEGRHGFFE